MHNTCTNYAQCVMKVFGLFSRIVGEPKNRVQSHRKTHNKPPSTSPQSIWQPHLLKHESTNEMKQHPRAWIRLKFKRLWNVKTVVLSRKVVVNIDRYTPINELISRMHSYYTRCITHVHVKSTHLLSLLTFSYMRMSINSLDLAELQMTNFIHGFKRTQKRAI